ncbi:hypothetical protein C1645_758619 [Glomus cerebriforme]|uniref:Mso1 N-terminal domain-containing protein n=1 Tax=Glomus cerebriforme TaxID=658196 RepID=A0A397T9U2_9GLOM|nr:hypothetical protein C1645_758619 [Glomus cerebriforme]
MVEVIDYRISRIVVLCKDCDQDVGLYPARHKCGISTSGGSKESLSSNNLTSNSNSNSNSRISSDLKNNSESNNGYNLWNKFMTSATTVMYNFDDDSDNESEKDDWDGETHISRILREYYENKGSDLPNWLYDSDSKRNLDSSNNSYEPQTERTSTKRQALPNRNENQYSSLLLEVNNNRGRNRQPRSYNGSTRDISPVQNHTSARTDRGRDKSAPPPNSFDRNNNIRNDKYYENSHSSPKSTDSRRMTNDRINIKNSNYNSLPSRRQPPPFPTTPDDYNASKRLISSKKSYNQLNSHYDNTLNKTIHVSPNRYNNYNNVQKGNSKDIPFSNSRVSHRNHIQGNYF